IHRYRVPGYRSRRPERLLRRRENAPWSRFLQRTSGSVHAIAPVPKPNSSYLQRSYYVGPRAGPSRCPKSASRLRYSSPARAAEIPISSIKSMLGHALGASAAIEAVVCILALREGWIPPTINLDDPDPECDLDYVPH